MANLGQKESAHFPSKEQLLKVSSKKRKTEGKKKKQTTPQKRKRKFKNCNAILLFVLSLSL